MNKEMYRWFTSIVNSHVPVFLNIANINKKKEEDREAYLLMLKKTPRSLLSG